MTPAAVSLDNVTRLYTADGSAVAAVSGVTIEFQQSEFAAIAGRSGCGKTTLLNLCGAMDLPTSGTVRIAGSCTSQLDDAGLTRLRRSQVGFIFQFFQLLPTLTVAENVELPAMLAGVSNPRPRALELLDWVDLASLAHRFPHQLSGGQMQRVAVARALINRPALLLADEPIGNLDTTTAEGVLQLLRRTAEEQKTTIVMATHSMESVRYCGKIVRLRDGRVESVEAAP